MVFGRFFQKIFSLLTALIPNALRTHLREVSLISGSVTTILMMSTLPSFVATHLSEETNETKIESRPQTSVDFPNFNIPKSEPRVAMSLKPAAAEPLKISDILSSVEERAKFDKKKVFADYDDRITEEFHIPDGLRARVSFWFDIYTHHDSNKHVIHHSLYPWIIYKVVDVSDIINADKPRARWMRNLKAEKVVKAELEKIKSTLRKLGKKTNLKNLSKEELLLSKALSQLPGKVQRSAKLALVNTRVQIGQKDHFVKGLIESAPFFPKMDEIFAARKLPTELTRLPLVESSFNTHATSKVGASGVWQFVDNTGKKFMIVNQSIDERRSPIKATDAAARLLKENHMILGRSWPLAITAYNHGPAGVKKAAKAVRTKDLSVIIQKYRTRNFNFATINYYCEFLAALFAEKYQEEIYGDLTPHGTPEMLDLALKRSIRVKQLLQITGLTQDELLRYNPDLKKAAKHNALLPRGFKLHFPDTMRSDFESLLTWRENNRAQTKERES